MVDTAYILWFNDVLIHIVRLDKEMDGVDRPVP